MNSGANRPAATSTAAQPQLLVVRSVRNANRNGHDNGQKYITSTRTTKLSLRKRWLQYTEYAVHAAAQRTLPALPLQLCCSVVQYY
jgi:hypothetical protein